MFYQDTSWSEKHFQILIHVFRDNGKPINTNKSDSVRKNK